MKILEKLAIILMIIGGIEVVTVVLFLSKFFVIFIILFLLGIATDIIGIVMLRTLLYFSDKHKNN